MATGEVHKKVDIVHDNKIQVADETDAAIVLAKECFDVPADTRDELVARVALAILVQRNLARVEAFQEVLDLKQPLTWGMQVMAAGYWLRCWLRVKIEALKAEVTAL